MGKKRGRKKRRSSRRKGVTLPSTTPATKPPPPTQTPPPQPKNFWAVVVYKARQKTKALVGAILTVGSLVGLALGWYYLVPDVTPPEIRAGDTPLRSPFTFSNNSFFTMKEVNPDCIILFLKTPQARFAFAQTSMIPSAASDIPPGEKRTYRCSTDVMGRDYEELRIAVCASYGLAFWPFRRFVEKRFYVLRSADGTPFWVAGAPIGDDPVPIPKTCSAHEMPPPREGQRPPR
jgi:hypothetical protein